MVVQHTLFIFLLTFTYVFNGHAIHDYQFMDPADLFTEGTVYRIEINERGIYRITGQWLAEQTGSSIGNVDVSAINIYSIASGPLKHNSDHSDTERLAPLSIEVVDNGDGIFGDNDEIIFYSEGPDRYYYDETAGMIMLKKNPFADKNYVFLKVDDPSERNDIRKETVSSSIQNPSTDYVYSAIYHQDKVNLLDDFRSTQGSGQDWYGDQLTNIDNYSLDNKVELPSKEISNIRIEAFFAGRSKQKETVTLNVNGTALSRDFSPVNTSDIEALYARKIAFSGASERLSKGDQIDVNFSKTDGDAKLWIDYFALQGVSQAIYESKPLFLNNYINQLESENFDGSSN